MALMMAWALTPSTEAAVPGTSGGRRMGESWWMCRFISVSTFCMSCTCWPAWAILLAHPPSSLFPSASSVLTVTHPVTQGEDFLARAEAAAQQPGGVQLLEPEGVADIGLLAGHAFDVPRIDQRGGGGE